jgi:hypothetical protein
MHNTGTEITKTITLFYIIYKLQRKTITFLQYTNYNEKRYDSNKPDHADGQLKIFLLIILMKARFSQN